MRKNQLFQAAIVAFAAIGGSAAAEPPSWQFLLSEAQGGFSKPEYYHFALSLSEQAIAAAAMESGEKGLNSERIRPYLVRAKAYDVLEQPDKPRPAIGPRSPSSNRCPIPTPACCTQFWPR